MYVNVYTLYMYLIDLDVYCIILVFNTPFFEYTYAHCQY